MRKFLTQFIILAATAIPLAAAPPEWLTHRPVSEEYFYGRGQGPTPALAEHAARSEIYLQLSSQINGIISLANHSAAQVTTPTEDIAAFISGSGLQSAEVEDRYKENGQHHVLLRYPETCAIFLAESTAVKYEDELNLDTDTVMEEAATRSLTKSARMEMVLNDAVTGNYGKDLAVRFGNDTIKIQVVNFQAYTASLSPGQTQALQTLSQTLFEELKNMNYSPASVTGHANPTGVENEETDLTQLSQARAETMASFLRQAGIRVGEVRGIGADELTGNTQTPEGRGLNRRVDIEVEIPQ